MRHERLAALKDLSPRLRSGGNDVDLQITDRVPGRVGVSFNQAEDVAIFIGGGVANVVLSRFTDDLYERVKLWAIARFHKKEEANTGGPHSPRRSASTDQTTRYSKPGRSTTTAKTNDDAGLQIRCSTVRVPVRCSYGLSTPSFS